MEPMWLTVMLTSKEYSVKKNEDDSDAVERLRHDEFLNLIARVHARLVFMTPEQ